MARIALSPTAILAHDKFHTQVTLDGRASAAIDDPGAGLGFSWRFENDEVQTTGDAHTPMLVATFRGDRVPVVVLTVTAPDGLEDTVQASVRLTLP